MFNMSFLLARNNTVTPWLSDFDTIPYDDPEIELLKENIACAHAVPADQVDFTHVQEMDGMDDSYEAKANSIIAQLVSMEGGSEECTMLLNNVSSYISIPHQKLTPPCLARVFGYSL